MTEEKMNNIKAIQAMHVIKETLKLFKMNQLSIIPDVPNRFMYADDELRLHLEVIGLDNKYILVIQEIDVTESQLGLGSLLLYIITKTCEELNCYIGLWTKKNNKIASNWYSKIGFKKSKVKGTTDLWWEKSFNKHTTYLEDKLIHKSKLELDLIIKTEIELLETNNLIKKLDKKLEELEEKNV